MSAPLTTPEQITRRPRPPDAVRRDDHGVEVVLEVELNEPSFIWSVDPGATDRFVAATVAEVGA